MLFSLHKSPGSTNLKYSNRNSAPPPRPPPGARPQPQPPLRDRLLTPSVLGAPLIPAGTQAPATCCSRGLRRCWQNHGPRTGCHALGSAPLVPSCCPGGVTERIPPYTSRIASSECIPLRAASRESLSVLRPSAVFWKAAESKPLNSKSSRSTGP